MISLTTLVIALLCSPTFTDTTIIDLLNRSGVAEHQQRIDKFYQQSNGKLIIYYSFGSLEIRHFANSQILSVKVEEELSEEGGGISEVNCSLTVVKQMNWLLSPTDYVRQSPPSINDLVDSGCSLTNQH